MDDASVGVREARLPIPLDIIPQPRSITIPLLAAGHFVQFSSYTYQTYLHGRPEFRVDARLSGCSDTCVIRDSLLELCQKQDEMRSRR